MPELSAQRVRIGSSTAAANRGELRCHLSGRPITNTPSRPQTQHRHRHRQQDQHRAHHGLERGEGREASHSGPSRAGYGDTATGPSDLRSATSSDATGQGRAARHGHIYALCSSTCARSARTTPGRSHTHYKARRIWARTASSTARYSWHTLWTTSLAEPSTWCSPPRARIAMHERRRVYCQPNLQRPFRSLMERCSHMYICVHIALDVRVRRAAERSRTRRRAAGGGGGECEAHTSKCCSLCLRRAWVEQGHTGAVPGC